ncbi:ABC transporter permease [Undibacterium arcticum]|uniref:ABC transporter permease n=1 Tax=Undibacterium arcticum TaxID=1762892 RepID=A0ABV7FAH2_9BURK
MRTAFFVVLHKELKEAMRDRRALVLLLLFVVMYPAILWSVLHNLIDKAGKTERESVELVVIGGAQVPTLVTRLTQRNVTVNQRGDMSDSAITDLLKERTQVAVVKVSDQFSDNYKEMRPAKIELWYDSAAEQQNKLRRIEAILRGYNESIAGARLLAHGVSPATLAPIQIEQFDTATSSSRSAGFAGALLGMFFATAFFFCMNTAMDSTAGERERRSLELLMAQPVHPFDLLAGKWMAAALVSVLGLTLELLVAHFILKWMPLEELGMSWRLSLPSMLMVIAVSIPLCLFAAAFEIALAMNAKSFKEAQTMMSFAILLPMLPVLVVPMLDLNTATWMYAVPVLANKTLLLEVAKGQAIGLVPFVLTAGVPLLGTAVAICFATWRIKSERYVLGV